MSKNKGFSSTSAYRYSLALYELASEANILTQVEDNSLAILELIKNCEEFGDLVKDPTINRENLTNVIQKITENFNL